MNSIINNFEDIPPNFDPELILFAVKCFGPITKSIDYTDSNGQSIVLISLEKNFVFQHYYSSKTFITIVKLFQILQHNPTCKYHLLDDSVSIDFDTFDHITKFYGTLKTPLPLNLCKSSLNIIKWEKITPIDPIRKGDNIQKFLVTNIIKFLFDIGKSLYSLHSKNIFHRDCTIDNIGINNKNNFMLFDYDFACSAGFFNYNHLLDEDYKKLLRSLKIYINDTAIVSFLEDILSYKDQMLSRLIYLVQHDLNHVNTKETLNFLSRQVIIEDAS